MKPSERIFEIARNLNHGTDATYISGEMLIAAIMTYLDEQYEGDKANADALAKRPAPRNKYTFTDLIHELS